MRRIHGGDIRAVSLERGVDASSIIDFSSSINPEGLPPAARDAAIALIRERKLSSAYPEPWPRVLISALSRYLSVPGENIAAGNGSTEIIYLLPVVLGARRALIVEPAFTEYAASLELHGVEVTPFFLHEEDDFRLDTEALVRALRKDRPHVLYMANPSNPVGRLVKRAEMLRISASCRETGTWFVVDEAFMDFCGDQSLIMDAAAGAHVVVLRSMTKFFAMAALRLGYAVAGTVVIARLRAHLPPWSVNAPAAAAAVASLSDGAYMERARAWLKMESPFMARGLKALGGIRTYPSDANFFTSRVTSPGLTATGLRDLLLERGLLIRELSDFRGLDGRFFRVALRDHESNALLMRELGKILTRARA